MEFGDLVFTKKLTDKKHPWAEFGICLLNNWPTTTNRYKFCVLGQINVYTNEVNIYDNITYHFSSNLDICPQEILNLLKEKKGRSIIKAIFCEHVL